MSGPGGRWTVAPLIGLAAALLVSEVHAGSPPPAAARRMVPRVVGVHPHDHGAFTQGLAWVGGRLYESTGQYGSSSLREVDLPSGRVLRRVDLPPDLFGEGLARFGDELLQLTWQEERLLVWDLATLARRGEKRYRGEGWGLASDGRRLVLSDGTDRLSLRDPATFAETGSLRVTLAGRPLPALNELEWAEGHLWANVWMTDEIVAIDLGTGRVTMTVDCSGLLEAAERRSADVLNGIAFVPERGTFLLTGKLWPRLFEVRFEASAAGP